MSAISEHNLSGCAAATPLHNSEHTPNRRCLLMEDLEKPQQRPDMRATKGIVRATQGEGIHFEGSHQVKAPLHRLENLQSPGAAVSSPERHHLSRGLEHPQPC